MRTRFWGRGWLAAVCAVVGMGLLVPAVAVARGSAAAVTEVGPAPAAQDLHLVLPLRANLTGLETFATQVTTVGSPMYGDFEPLPALARRFGVSSADRATVLRYLNRSGATGIRIDATGLFADANFSVGRAEALFGAQLRRFHSARAGGFVAPSGAAHVPVALRGAVTGVVGLSTEAVPTSTNVGAVRSAGPQHSNLTRSGSRVVPANTDSAYDTRTGTASGCSAAVGGLAQGFTPSQYLTAYGLGALHAEGIEGQGERAAVVEINGYKYNDVRQFAACFGLPLPGIHPYGVNIRHLLAPGAETTLDLEVLDAAAPAMKGIDVYEGQARASDLLDTLIAPLQHSSHLPDIVSISLGICDPVLKLAVGRSGVNHAEGIMALAAASGISLLASSGDDGSSSCITHLGPADRKAANFPASSPFVTGVGGTNIALTAANQIDAQTVWNDAPRIISAGGGFTSQIFSRPGFQNGFNGSRARGVPDVSMLADLGPGYNIYCSVGLCTTLHEGAWVAVGGTSAAAPLLAGGMALIDQVLRAFHRQALGNANSLLYRVARHGPAGVIRDVTTNDNDIGAYLSGSGHHPLGCCSAHAGYDLASGLGSVNVANLAAAAVRLQPKVARLGVALPRQRPSARHGLLARISCSRNCIVGAGAFVLIPGQKPIHVGSGLRVLRRKGSHTFTLRFSRRQDSGLRTALRHRRKVIALVYGEQTDAGGTVIFTTRVHSYRITH